jgi:hypothetical protein
MAENNCLEKKNLKKKDWWEAIRPLSTFLGSQGGWGFHYFFVK